MKKSGDFYRDLLEKRDGEVEHYDGRKADRYNAALVLSIGGRNIGKTYYRKSEALYKFLTKGEQAVYLRRNEEELKKMKRPGFFPEKMLAQCFYEFAIIDFEVSIAMTKIVFMGDGEEYDMRITSSLVTINKKPFLYFAALSTWGKLKSSEYDDVWRIIFDEVLIDMSDKNRHYIPDEVEALFQTISTIFRDREHQMNVYLLSNATNYNNPYFIYFGFRGDQSKRYWYLKEFSALIEFPENKGVTEESSPKQMRLMRKSKVLASNSDNAFQESYENNVGRIPGHKTLLYSIYSEGTFFTAYHCNTGEFYIAKGYDKNLQVFSFEKRDVEHGFIYLTRSDPISRHIRSHFYNSLIFYDELDTKMRFQNSIGGII